MTQSKANQITGNTQNPRRVLILSQTLITGGSQRLIAELASIEESTEFTYEYAYVSSFDDQYSKLIRGFGRTTHLLNGRVRNVDVRWAWRLRKLLRSSNFDVLHTNGGSGSGIARVVAWSLTKYRPIVINTSHNEWGLLSHKTRVLDRLTAPLCDELVAVSRTTAATYPSRISHRMIVIYQGINMKALLASTSDISDPLIDEKDIVVIGTLARLAPEKNLSHLVRVAAVLKSKGKIFRIRIAGDGPEREILESLAQQLDVHDVISFEGPVIDVPTFLNRIDIFCLTSFSEGLPVSLIEAIAAGKPVVATMTGGIPEIIRNGIDGILVSLENPTNMANAIELLMDNPEKRRAMGSAAKSRAHRFDIHRTRDETEAVYLRLLMGQRTGHRYSGNQNI